MPALPMLLGLLFVGLKLTGHIDWSWFWVTCPWWFGLALVLVAFVIFSFAKGFDGLASLLHSRVG